MIGWRKFSLAVLVVLLSAYLCWDGKMTDSIAAQLIGAVVAFYVGGNVAGKWSPKTNGEVKP